MHPHRFSKFWRKILTPTRLVALLAIASIFCAALIFNFSEGGQLTKPEASARAARLLAVHNVVEAADVARETLHRYEATRDPADKAAFLAACDSMAAYVNTLRVQEHISGEQSDQIIDLCVSIHQKLGQIGLSLEDRMAEAGNLLDRARRAVLGIGLKEMSDQDNKLAEQSAVAVFHRKMTSSMAVVEIFLIAGIAFLVVRLTRLEQLATVCAWSHRLLYNGQWVSLERYLDERFGIRASDGITTDQAARLMAENEKNGQELVRLIEFEKMAGVRAKEANAAIHAVRNHLTAVLCYSEMAGSGDPEAQRDMASRVLTHANTISNEVDALHKAVRAFNPGPPDLRVVRKPTDERAA